MTYFSMSSSTYRSPAFIGLLGVMSVAVVLLLHHCILVTCCSDERRRRRRSRIRRGTTAQQQREEEQEQESVDELSSSSRVQLVAKAAPAVVCRYRKEEEWSEPTCPVCLADFADGEAVRVLPECLHYFHADCIDTWLRAGNASCPMCRADTTPTPTPSPAELHHQLSLSVSLEDILVHT